MPEQTVHYWDKVKGLVDDAIPKIPGETENKMNNILANLLSGKFLGWFDYYVDKEGNKKTDGIIITTILKDDVTETKSLLIYCIAAFSKVPMKNWKDSLKGLGKYAKSRGCSRMISYSIPKIVPIIKRAWSNSSGEYCLVSYPL